MAVLNPGDKFLGLNLSHGGHLSHGSPVNFSGLMFHPLEYSVKEDTGYVDYDMMGRGSLRRTSETGIIGHEPRLLLTANGTMPAHAQNSR